MPLLLNSFLLINNYLSYYCFCRLTINNKLRIVHLIYKFWIMIKSLKFKLQYLNSKCSTFLNYPLSNSKLKSLNPIKKWWLLGSYLSQKNSLFFYDHQFIHKPSVPTVISNDAHRETYTVVHKGKTSKKMHKISSTYMTI